MPNTSSAKCLFNLGDSLRRILDAELAAGNRTIERTDFILPLQIDLDQPFHDVYCRIWPLPGVRYSEERDIRSCVWEDCYSHGIYSIVAPGMDDQTPADLEERKRFTALTEKARSEGRLLPAAQWRGATLTATERYEQLPLCAKQICDELEHEMRRIDLWTQTGSAGADERSSAITAAARASAGPQDSRDVMSIARWIQFDLIPQARSAAAGHGPYPRTDRFDVAAFATLEAHPPAARLSRMMHTFAYVFSPSAR